MAQKYLADGTANNKIFDLSISIPSILYVLVLTRPKKWFV